MADLVKSVEFVEVDTTGEAISHVLTKGQDYTNCVPFLSNHGGQDYIDTKLWDCYFSGTTESGNIHFERWNGRSTAGYVKCFVVEFDPAEVYVEQGEFDLSSLDYTEITTTSGFNPERTGMIHHWACSDGNNFYPTRTLVRGRVTASGTIDFHRASVAANIVPGHWYIFEAKNNQFIVKHDSFSTNSADYASFPGHSCDLLKTFIIASISRGFASNAYPDRSTGYVTITNRDTFEWHRAYTGGDPSNVAYQMIEFQDQKIHVPYKNNPTIDATIKTYNWDSEGRTSIYVDLDYSMVINTCSPLDYCNSPSTTSVIDGLASSVKFTGVSGIQIEKNTQSISTIPSIFVVDWKGYTIDTGTNPSPIDPNISFVKSVQNGTISTTAKTNFLALTKGQDINNCVIFGSQHATTTANSPYNYMHDLYFSDVGAVVANRAGTNSDGVAEISVVEFYPDQVRVQSGTVGGTVLTPEFSVNLEHTIDPAKSFVLAKWSSRTSSVNWSHHNIRQRIIDENTLGFYAYKSSIFNHLTWFLAEDITEDNSCFQSFHWLQQDGSNVGRGLSNDMHFPYYQTFIVGSMADSADIEEYPDRQCARSYYYAPNQPQMMTSAANNNTRYFSGTAVKIVRSGRQYTAGWTPVITDLISSGDTLPTSWSGIENITAYNTMSLSYAQQNTTTQNATGAVFCSVNIPDYNSLTVYITRGQSGYTAYPGFCFICWPGGTYFPTIEQTPTRSVVCSIEKFSLTGTNRIYRWPLTKGQYGPQCVPFATWNVRGTGGSDDCFRYFTLDPGQSEPYNLSMYRSAAGASTSDITQVYVVEFSDEKVKVQSGTYGLSSNDVSITIEEVDLTKAFLHFYSFAEGNQSWESQNVVGTFTDSTTLRFRRQSSGGNLFIAWYVVECLQDQWRVQHLYSEPMAGGYDYYNTLEYAASISKRWVFCSYTGGYTTAQYSDRSTCRMITSRTNNLIQINRSYSGDSIYRYANEVVEFNKGTDFRVFWEDVSTNASSNTYPNLLEAMPPVEEKRMLVFNAVENNINRCNGTTHSTTTTEAFFLYELIDFDIDDPKLRVTKEAASALSTYGAACMTEVPEFNKYYMEGYTKERGNPVPREVRAYRADTGEMMDYTMSVSGTGYFWLETTYSGAHYVICLDDEAVPDYNDLIYSRIYPTTISGSFAWNEGLVTTSGVEYGVPLGRL